MIQKYIPEDISIWKDWLVYGTALGVGKNVVKSMDQLKIPAIPEVHAVTFAPAHFERAYSRSAEHVTTKSEIAAMQSMGSGRVAVDSTLTLAGEAVLVAVVEEGAEAVEEEDTGAVVVEPGEAAPHRDIFPNRLDRITVLCVRHACLQTLANCQKEMPIEGY